MSGCGVLFKRSRRWQTFCSTKCRNDFHALETRREAVRAAGPSLYAALRKIIATDCYGVPDDPTALPCPHCIAREAIKDLKAP